MFSSVIAAMNEAQKQRMYDALLAQRQHETIAQRADRAETILMLDTLANQADRRAYLATLDPDTLAIVLARLPYCKNWQPGKHAPIYRDIEWVLARHRSEA